MQAAEAVHWRYSSVRGGAPAVYDADLGAHIAFFHTAPTRPTRRRSGRCAREWSITANPLCIESRDYIQYE